MKKICHQQTPSASQPLLLLPYLPQEIIADILTRLSVKTLIKFKCVSKSWLYLISSTTFIRTHLGVSSKINNFSRHRLISIYRHKDDLLKKSSIYSYPEKSSSMASLFDPQISSDESVELDYPLSDCVSSISFVDSCNGLVCLATGKQETVIWNPSTRESKKLPFPGESNHQKWFIVLGFGYDQLNDDYKVVIKNSICRFVEWFKEVMVYSLKTNAWRKISDFPYDNVARYYLGKFFSGALHWQSKVSRKFSSTHDIVSLDLGKETYGEIPQPDYGDGDFQWGFTVLAECLSVCCNYINSRVDIWVMKEYGVRDSWIKMYTIPNTVFLKNFGKSFCVPLFSFKTGEILFMFLKGMVLYDPNSGTFSGRVSRDWFYPLRLTTYVESLVSPNIYNEVGIENL